MSYETENASTLTVLQEAEKIINGQRREDYGGVYESFKQLADYWSIYISRKIKVKVELHPLDIVNLMELMKVSRAQNGYHRDSYVDMAGYAGCAEKIIFEESLIYGEPKDANPERIR